MMKPKILIIAFLFGVVCSWACDDFLEETSQNEMKPSSADDLQQLLNGEVYVAGHSSDNIFHMYLELLTDNVSCRFVDDTWRLPLYEQYYPVYTWQDDMYELLETNGKTQGIDTYAHYYRGIKGCNVVLDMLDKVTGSDAQKANVEGQALAMRGYFYFMLVNLYAQPYNAPGIDVNEALGVPLILRSEVKDDYPFRASIASVYESIESDLLRALDLLKENGQENSPFRATDMFCYTMLSRMYLYMENWEEAVKYASMGLDKNPRLLNLASVSSSYESMMYPPTENVYSRNSPELIWAGYGNANQYDFATGYFTFVPSDELLALYQYNHGETGNRGDLRLRYYYKYAKDYAAGGTMYEPICGLCVPYPAETNYPIKGLRVAELYLNRAEANIRLYLENSEESLREEAIKDLNYLRSCRIETQDNSSYEVNYAGEELLSFCLDERRREFAWQDHRWFDLRRCGMPEISHVFQASVVSAPVTYVLEQGGNRYVLPIPRSALDKNYNLQQNP